MSISLLTGSMFVVADDDDDRDIDNGNVDNDVVGCDVMFVRAGLMVHEGG
jgi:hypothetical protein